MIENKQVIIYSFGFEFDGILYCWKNKELFRMPYNKDNRYYSKRKLKIQKNGGSYGYWVSGLFKSLSNLKQITRNINYTEELIIESDCPF